jgi:BirA family biotin operon repressor/biotin-[acetyl-CoA-carboxylase] ligase
VRAAPSRFISRREHYAVVGSTNDVARAWLAQGTPEVCLAVADLQTSGRGREGRSWQAPAGAALLLSLGFRPTWLRPEQTWRLAAVVSLAMADAGESVAGLPTGTIRLKWPNDLGVGDAADGHVRKLAGVLGETDGLGGPDPRAVIGIGTNADWAATDFPPQLASDMTSLRDLGGRRIENNELLEGFLHGLESRLGELRRGIFPAAEWQRRQLTDGRPVVLELADGTRDSVVAKSVDPTSGGLVVHANGRSRTVLAGEIRHVRLDGGTSAAGAAHTAVEV